MAALKVKKLWTVFLTAFFAVLASLGLTTPAGAVGGVVRRPAGQPAGGPAAAPVVRPRVARTAQVRTVLPRQAERDRSLPPTIKQRIRAEAHGSSPSVRRMPVDTWAATAAAAAADVGNVAGLRTAATTTTATATAATAVADPAAGARTRTGTGAFRGADAVLATA